MLCFPLGLRTHGWFISHCLSVHWQPASVTWHISSVYQVEGIIECSDVIPKVKRSFMCVFVLHVSLRSPALQCPWTWTVCPSPQNSCHVTTLTESSPSSTLAASTSLVISLRLETKTEGTLFRCANTSYCKHITVVMRVILSPVYWWPASLLFGNTRPHIDI